MGFPQRIPSGGDGQTLKFFGQSIHGEMDLNGDGLTDVTIGGLGGAALFWCVSSSRRGVRYVTHPSRAEGDQGYIRPSIYCLLSAVTQIKSTQFGRLGKSINHIKGTSRINP